MGKPWWKDHKKPETPAHEWSSDQVVDECAALACRYLTQRGMEVVEQDWSCCRGVVPIIAKEEDGTVVLVDVMSDMKLNAGPNSMPNLEITERIQHIYRELALFYLLEHEEAENMRFDVVSIQLQGESDARLRHLVGNFTWES